MHRSLWVAAALGAALTLYAAGVALAGLAGPILGGVTGNDTGGIIPYSPDVEPIYHDIAAAHCARWFRLSRVTSVHRQYGDYISFVCIDKPWIIH